MLFWAVFHRRYLRSMPLPRLYLRDPLKGIVEVEPQANFRENLVGFVRFLGRLVMGLAPPW